MAGYTKSGVIGRPSLGSADKGKAVLRSLVQSFEPRHGVLTNLS
jgi:creatinine amidohydrolase